VKDWNVVVSVYQSGFRRAIRALQELGPVEHSPYHNVLVMKAEYPLALLESVEKLTEARPALYDAISRVAPATRAFDFSSAEEFRDQARLILLEWQSRLGGRAFHVRLHRRGAGHDLPTSDTERFLDDTLLDAMVAAGEPGKLSFTDPDAVIAIDTVDGRAGMSLSIAPTDRPSRPPSSTVVSDRPSCLAL
jgi:hypothetical protein